VSGRARDAGDVVSRLLNSQSMKVTYRDIADVERVDQQATAESQQKASEIFNEFLDDINEDVLPNDLTGYQDPLIWKKLFNYQKDAATGIINKLEYYSPIDLAQVITRSAHIFKIKLDA
jgi:hypothetical protein